MKAIIIEMNDKGYYKRYALTPEEFEAEFENRLDDDMPEPSEFEAEGYTLRVGVHMWYRQVTVRDKLWDVFFTDMEWGLPPCDIEDGNLAYIDYNSFGSLIGRL